MANIEKPIIADTSIQYLIDAFARNRAEMEKLKILESELRERICAFMGEHDVLKDINGEKLANWTYKNGQKRFDTEAFRAAHPILAKQFVKTGEPTRAFSVLVKVV